LRGLILLREHHTMDTYQVPFGIDAELRIYSQGNLEFAIYAGRVKIWGGTLPTEPSTDELTSMARQLVMYLNRGGVVFALGAFWAEGGNTSIIQQTVRSLTGAIIDLSQVEPEG
jgi:hypothetical protein